MENKINKKANRMEFNKITVSIISILITLSISFGGFCYRTGATNNELKNIKEQQKCIKKELKEEILKVEENSARKDIVDLIFQKIGSIESKLDRLIESKGEIK